MTVTDFSDLYGLSVDTCLATVEGVAGDQYEVHRTFSHNRDHYYILLCYNCEAGRRVREVWPIGAKSFGDALRVLATRVDADEE